MKNFSLKNIISYLPLLTLILAGTVFQGIAMFKSGRIYDFGIGYWGPLARDGVWHEALSAAIARGLPPDNPGFAGLPLTNYHYFYDLLVALSHLLTKIPTSFFIYRIFPVIFSLAIGLLTYALSLRLFKDKAVALISVFFIYFGSSFGWIVGLIKGEQIGGESAFWANQPVSMNLNPPFAISLVIVAAIIILLDLYLSRPAKKYACLLILLSGFLIGFKVYAGVLVLGALVIISLKRKNLFIILIPAVLISACLFFLQERKSLGLLEVNPFWLINTMIDAGDRVGIANFTARRFAYLGGHKWFHFVVLEIISFLIFFAGNLGTRIIAFFGLKKAFLKSDTHLFILVMSTGAIIFPLIFVQKGNPWNIIQFFYYALFLGSLYAAYTLTNIYRKLPRVAGIFGIIFVLSITPISSIAAFRGWSYPNPPAKISKEEYQALTFLSKEPWGIVFTHQFDPQLRVKLAEPYPIYSYADSAYVSAYSNKDVFLEDVEQQIVLGVNYKSRLSDSELFFTEKNGPWASEFLRSNKIKYIYLPKAFILPRAESELPIKKIFENKEVNIYKVIQ